MSELWQIYDNIYLFPDEMQSKICAMLQAYIKCLCIIYTYEATSTMLDMDLEKVTNSMNLEHGSFMLLSE